MATPPPLSASGEAALAAFRGLPSGTPRVRRAIGMQDMDLPVSFRGRMDRVTANATSIDSLVEVLLERHHLLEPRRESRLMEHWTEVFGAVLAPKCSPMKLDPTGVLFIAVSDPSLRQELLFRRAGILRRLQQIAGPGRLRDIVFRAG